MAKQNTTIREEPELKEQVSFCHELPFEGKVDEPNEVTYATIEAAEKGDDMYGPFDSVDDLMVALDA